MKISCTNTMVPGSTLTQKAEHLQDCGFAGISVFEDISSWAPEKEEELLTLEARTGIKVCEFCFSGDVYGQLMNSDASIASRSKSIYIKTIEIGNKLGSVSEMEYQYAARTPVPLLDPYLKMSEEENDRFVALYSELAAMVKGDSYLLLEAINRYESPYLNNMEDNSKIIEQVNQSSAGLLFDTFHMAIEEVDMCATFKKYAPNIKHVHLGDNNRLLPGNGNLPWVEIFASMRDAGYNGFVNLECAILGDDILPQLKRQAAFLKTLIE